MSKTGREIAEILRTYEPPEWDRLPDMKLYMDQLLTVLASFPGPTGFCGNGEETERAGLLTANMVNNYVKEGYVPHPQGRRYDRDSVALLHMLTVLKPVLSIPDAACELHVLKEELGVHSLSRLFADDEVVACKRVAELIETGIGDESLNDVQLALRLAVEANILRQCSQKLIDGLQSARQKN